MATAFNPLPSLIRASAFDAANMQMRSAGRSKWSVDDYNHAAATLERLIRACYGRPGDHNNPNIVYIRFQIAESMERRGLFHLDTDVREIHAQIEAMLAPEAA